MSLAFRGVTCTRGGRTLFADLSFALDAGGAGAVRGPNGIGKSSLLRIAAGLMRPAAGVIEGARERGSWLTPLALLAETSALDGERTLGAALLFWARLDGGDAQVRRDAALDATGLSGIVDVPVRLLSTGQRRRAAFARVLASHARIWLLDEPASGLDTSAIGQLETLLARHRAAGGIALVATHQPLDLPAAVAIDLAGAAAVLAA